MGVATMLSLPLGVLMWRSFSMQKKEIGEIEKGSRGFVRISIFMGIKYDCNIAS